MSISAKLKALELMLALALAQLRWIHFEELIWWWRMSSQSLPNEHSEDFENKSRKSALTLHLQQ